MRIKSHEQTKLSVHINIIPGSKPYKSFYDKIHSTSKIYTCTETIVHQSILTEYIHCNAQQMDVFNHNNNN